MPTTTTSLPAVETLKDVTRLIQTAEGFHPIVAALKNGRGAVVDGAWGSSASLVTAALGLHAPRTLLVVIAHPRDLDAWADDLHSFSGTRPAVFPAWDHLPDEDTVADEVAGQRLRLLKALEHDSPPRYVLTTIQALIQPVPDRAQLSQGKRVLSAGAAVDLDELSGWLLDHGYRRADAVELPGEFSRRGGIFDVYSPDAEAPYRLEFFGDEIESIRQFSPHTQRSLGNLTSAELMALTGDT
jgi:transcription-repair coupling factor (superfamily II helicase)